MTHYVTLEVSAGSMSTTHIAVGYRLRFKGVTSFVTRNGGTDGCLKYNSSAQDFANELMSLATVIDRVQVDISISADRRKIQYQVTFTGALVRGSNPLLEVIDNGVNGCNSAPSGYSVASTTVEFQRHSYLPVYRLLQTPMLPFDCSAADMKEAIEGVSPSIRVDVSKRADTMYNLFEWMVTFRALRDMSTREYPPKMLVNDLYFSAAVNGAVVVTSVGEYSISQLPSGVSQFVSVVAQNSYGTGYPTQATPASKQPSDQVPSPPLFFRVRIGADSALHVQFSTPVNNGGPVIIGYRLQWDFKSSFNAGWGGQDPRTPPAADIFIPAADFGPRGDVQLVSVVSKTGANPGGSFVLIYGGQRTKELDYNISAVGVKAALEGLININSVNVERFLFCSQESGRNNCNERGYTWRITFVDVIENGNQFEEYTNSYETAFNYRLSVTGTYLKSCTTFLPSSCKFSSDTSVFIGSQQEQQSVCIPSGLDTASWVTIGAMGYNSIYLPTLDAAGIKSALETIPAIGRVSVTPSGVGACVGVFQSQIYTVTFLTTEGDVPSINITTNANGGMSYRSQEIHKGLHQFVSGFSDYNITLQSKNFSTSDVYIRLAAVNVIGLSQYVYPYYTRTVPVL